MTSKDIWTKTQTFELIKLFKKFPNLYNANHENFKNRPKRHQAYRLIQEKLNEVKQNVTIKEIKSKIKTIRSQYTKEKHAIENAIKDGDKDRGCQPKLWFYYDIKFIDPDTTQNIDKMYDYSDDDDTLDLDYNVCDINNEEDIKKIEILNKDNLNKIIGNNESLNDESSHDESIKNEKLTEDRLKYEIIPNDNEEIYDYEDQIDDTENLTNMNISQVNKTKTEHDLLEDNCRKSLELAQKMAQSFNNINKEKSHLYYFIKSIESDLLALPTKLQQDAKWKIQNVIRESQVEHLKLTETNKKRNFEIINDQTNIQRGKIIPISKRSNININSKSLSNIPSKIFITAKDIQDIKKHDQMKSFEPNTSTTVYSSKPQIGTPKIYQVIKPIPKHNSSQISSTVILGESSILDTGKRENSPIWIE